MVEMLVAVSFMVLVLGPSVVASFVDLNSGVPD